MESVYKGRGMDGMVQGIEGSCKNLLPERKIWRKVNFKRNNIQKQGDVSCQRKK